MKLRLAIVLLAASAAPSAFAQETQQDLAERIVREQEDVHRRALDKVMTAPDYAARMRSGEVGALLVPSAEAEPSKKKPQPAPEPAKPAGRPWDIPWVLIACLLPVVPFLLYLWATWRRRELERS